MQQPHVRYDDLPLETKDGQIRHVELVGTLFLADNKPFAQCTIHDITARIQREREDGERARQESLSATRAARRTADEETHDQATGLVNRWYLEETLPRELHRAARAKTPLTVSVLEADGDQELGEAVLREVGRVVREHLRKSDMACRYSDRDFILVLPESSPPATLTPCAERSRACWKTRSFGRSWDGRGGGGSTRNSPSSGWSNASQRSMRG